MTDRPPVPLWLRLTVCGVGLALLAVLVLAAFTAIFTDRYVNRLVTQRQKDLTNALVVEAASAYDTGRPGWGDVDLRPGLLLASRTGTDVAVLDQHGAVVATTFPNLQRAPGAKHYPIPVHGVPVGTLYVKFGGRGLVQDAGTLRRSLLHALVWSAGVAALAALAVAILVARRLTEPLERLTSAAAAMSRGNREARVGQLPGAPAELHNLAVTFDQMADTLVRHEQVRRDLVSDLAHELRTPVAVLQANTEAILDGIVPYDREQAASLHEEILRLAARVDDLQTLANAEAAALHLNKVRCDLAAVAATATEAMASTAAAADVELHTDLESAVIEADPVRLHQVITNLLANAIKFTAPEGKVIVQVRPEGPDAVLTVTDTGEGISADDIPMVFERFWRGRHSATTPGSGIGLAIVADLVQAHRGTVSVTSTVGEGSCFLVRLPAASGRF